MMETERGCGPAARTGWARVAAVAAQPAMWAVCAAAAPAAWAAEGGEGGDPWMTLMWKGINFVILWAVIIFFARKPVAAMFRAAAQEARDALEGRRERARKAEEATDEQRSRIENLEAELERLLNEAREEARAEHERMVAEAHTHAERIKTSVQLQVEQSFNRARQELQADLARETVNLAEKMIRERMDDSARERIVTRAIDDLGAGS